MSAAFRTRPERPARRHVRCDSPRVRCVYGEASRSCDPPGAFAPRPPEGSRLRRALALAVVILFPALAGCYAARGEASSWNFELAPDRVGWNVGEVARFTLQLKPALLAREPAYTIDRDLAIAEIELDQSGFSFGGDYRTRNAGDVDLRLWSGGGEIQETRLDAANPSVGLSIVLPADLSDAEYALGLKLFKVGWISSGEFRVNVP